MLRRNHGHIVNIASSAGLVGLNKLTDYSASKFGVVGFTEVLNYEVVYSGYSGVYTTLVCPSFIKTGMFDGCEMRYDTLNCTARQCSPLRRKLMECSIINPALSLLVKHLVIGQRQKALNFSDFHWSPHTGSLVSIDQHFVSTRVVHLPKRTETS